MAKAPRYLERDRDPNRGDERVVDVERASVSQILHLPTTIINANEWR